jgi:hypothetical protein
MNRKLALILGIMFITMAFLCACGNNGVDQSTEAQSAEQNNETETMDTTGNDVYQTELNMMIGEIAVKVEWEDNESVSALKELVKDGPLVIQMSMYDDFEQVGSLGKSLPRDDAQTITKAGDIVLYSGNQIVVFYGSNSWAYTRLGHVTDKTAQEMTELLGNGNVTITIYAE